MNELNMNYEVKSDENFFIKMNEIKDCKRI